MSVTLHEGIAHRIARARALVAALAAVPGLTGACAGGDLMPAIGSTAQPIEICSGGTDDDLDGLIDCVDPDCFEESSCTGIQPCTGDLFQVANGQLFLVNPATTPFTLSSIGAPLSGSHNALGYNVKDGFFYLLDSNDGLRRVNSVGQESNLGTIAGLQTSGGTAYFVGDFDLSGNLWIHLTGGRVSKIDVATRTVVDSFTVSGFLPADWAFNPDTGKFYGVESDTLYVMDPATRSVSQVELTGDINHAGTYGAAFVDANGILFVIHNAAAVDGGLTRAINVATGEARTVGIAQPASSNDGASCPLAAPPFEICGNGQDDDGDGDIDEDGSVDAGNTCIDVPDTDGDGVVDSADLDDDNDGIPDVFDGPGDTDGDGVPDRLDLDSDNDGINDVNEAGHDAADANGDGMVDGDPGDFGPNGLADELETSPGSASLDYDSDGEGNDRPLDTDGDGTPDFQDLDSDGDTVTDLIEGGLDPAEVDANGDGMIDPGASSDADHDGILGPADGSPGYGDANTAPLPDTDMDGTPDFQDLDADGDGIADEDEAGDGDLSTVPVDTDGDGIPDFQDLDSDGDTISDTIEAGDGELDTPPVDTDDDGVPDFQDLDSDGDGLNDGDEAGDEPGAPSDSDGDGIPDFRDVDADNDTIPDGEDNCPVDGNPDQADGDGDGIGAACDPDEGTVPGGFFVAGGGCSIHGDGRGGAGTALLVLLALCAMARRWRRMLGALALALALALAIVLGPVPAAAQAQLDSNFSLERFRMSMDRGGMLDVEWAAVPRHLSWDLSLWVSTADDPLVVYRQAELEGERAGSLIGQRTVGTLVGAIALWNRVQLGVELPIILAQSNDEIDQLMSPDIASAGLGDVRIVPKLQIVGRGARGFSLSVLPALTVPTGSATDFRGEDGLAFAPELAASYGSAGGFLVSTNLGYLARGSAQLANLQVDDEILARLGVGYHFGGGGPPLLLAATVSAATSASSPFGASENDHIELHGGATYDVAGPLQVIALGGVGLNQGFGTPDWRAVVGMRLSSERGHDADGDGIVDAADSCPLEPEDLDAFEDSDGCPDLDNDGDGVPDTRDGAPNEPEDKDGFADADGVPDPDNDGDQILDQDDQCPVAAETVNGFEDYDGCPDELPDSDGDGMADTVDDCPSEAEDVDGFEDDNGCPDPDNDGDGVLDASDECISVPGHVRNRGCPDTDRDGDTVVDRLDGCPDEPGPPDNNGCKKKSNVRLTDTAVQILEQVHFETNKATIKRRSHTLLRNVAAVLAAHPEIKLVQVEGHTDDRSDDEYNMQLSQRRAEAVVQFLIKEGIAAERLVAKGFGETRPIASNARSSGRAKNRRVEFNIIDDAAGAGGSSDPR